MSSPPALGSEVDFWSAVHGLRFVVASAAGRRAQPWTNGCLTVTEIVSKDASGREMVSLTL